MDRCTGRITEKALEKALNIIQSINQSSKSIDIQHMYSYYSKFDKDYITYKIVFIP